MSDNLIMRNRIRERMSEVGINAKQLAEKAEVGKSFVYDILNGKSKNPTSNKLSSISKHLGIPLSYIMNSEENSVDIKKYISILCIEDEDSQESSILLLKSLVKHSPDAKFYSFIINDDSMEPTFYKGDIVIVDVSKREGEALGFFLIKDNFSITVRRVEHIMGSSRLRIIADNTKYATYEQELSKIQLMGKVSWYFRNI